MLENDILYNGKKGSFWYVDNSGKLKIVYSQFTHKLYCKTSKGYDVVTNSQGIIKNSVFFYS